MLKTFLCLMFCALISHAGPLRIAVRQIGLSQSERDAAVEKVLALPQVKNILQNKNFYLVARDFEENSISSQVDYTFFIYNYSDLQMLRLSGSLNSAVLPYIEIIADDLPASPEEFAAAVEILKEDPVFGVGIHNGELVPYEPMPTTIAQPELLRGLGGPRIISVGLESPLNPSLHEIIGVNLANLKVIRFADKAPPTSLATERVCGLANAGQAVTGKGRAGSAQIDISDNNGSLWNFTVLRPSASSGHKGSGLEIRNVYYRGNLILKRAHTPILNVQYAGNRCGPYRDWSYAENYFRANGSDQAPGIRIASEKPSTIFDTGVDRGNFRGVAIYEDEDKILLVTEFSAGWYRYASKFELYPDGTIKPLFQFSAVRNSCVCYSHHHHVYWRFDFDINGLANSATVSNGESFRPITRELSQVKNDDNIFWRISHNNGNFYDVTPGKDDGYADSYGIADAWFLRYRPDEIDDGNVRNSTRAALNSFINNENLENQDLVMWYSGHFRHKNDGRRSSYIEESVGPVLKPSVRK